MLRIGFDAKRLFNNYTGLGNYSRTLVRNLQSYYPDNEYVLFSPKLKINSETEPFFSTNFEIVKGKGPLWRSLRINSDISQSDIDIYHGLSHEIPIGIEKTNCLSVVSIHDLIYKFEPQDFNPIDRKIYDFKFKYACNHSNKIIAISESTKTDIIKHYGVDENKISVIYQTCSDIFKKQIDKEYQQMILQKYNLPSQFLLYVGSIIERKQLLQAVKAIKQLKGIINLPLVVIGDGRAYKQKVVDYIKKNNIETSVIFPGKIQYADLPAIYNAARIFLYPSKYEGFGIPIIESLYCKTPVITSTLSSLPEAAGPGAVYIEPEKPESIADAIVKLVTNPDLYKYTITQGFNHVQSFNSEVLTKNLHDLYNTIMVK